MLRVTCFICVCVFLQIIVVVALFLAAQQLQCLFTLGYIAWSMFLLLRWKQPDLNLIWMFQAYNLMVLFAQLVYQVHSLVSVRISLCVSDRVCVRACEPAVARDSQSVGL